MNISTTKKGFTLLEILIVVIIISTISALSYSAFSRYRAARSVELNAGIIVTAILEARQNTMDSLDSSQYGIHFTQDTMTVFKGESFAGGTIFKEYNLTGPVNLSEISLGGENEVVFERLTGRPSNSGFVRVQVKNNSDFSKLVIIEGTGTVYVQ